MKLFGLKNCDTCRAAMKDLAAAGQAIEFVDVRADGVPKAVLDRALSDFGAALVNRRSATWRGLSDAERETPPAELLRAHPTLMKRPLIEVDGQLYLGWAEAVRTALIS